MYGLHTADIIPHIHNPVNICSYLAKLARFSPIIHLNAHILHIYTQSIHRKRTNIRLCYAITPWFCALFTSVMPVLFAGLVLYPIDVVYNTRYNLFIRRPADHGVFMD